MAGISAGELVRIGFQSIRMNMFRAALTMLGIVIGVGSVIAMIALSTGAQRAIDEQLQSLGTDIILVRPGNRYRQGISERAGTINSNDATAILADAESVVDVVPEQRTYLTAKFGNVNHNIATIGTTPNFADLHEYRIRAGDLFGLADINSKRRVAVVGSNIPGKFRIDTDTFVGQTIYLQGIAFEVIGVLQPIGSSGRQNFDEHIWVPLSTSQQRLSGTRDLDTIKVRIMPDEAMDLAMIDIERVMRREHRILPGRNNDFTIGDPAAFLNVRRAANDVFAYLLASVAAVSLVVGGIGTMNIMLVTVTERTAEIGLRKALGAGKSSILLQFLVEAIVLCSLGGMVGVVFGAGVSEAMRHILDWEMTVSPTAVVAAFGFSMFIGVFFGIWPARKAAALSPVDALRHE